MRYLPLLLILGATAFGQCVNQGFNDFEGAAGQVTSSSVQGTQHGITNMSWGLWPTGAVFTRSTDANFPLTQATGTLCGDSTNYPAGQGSMGVIENSTTNAGRQLEFTLIGGLLKSAAVWFCSDMAASDATYDAFMLRGQNGDYANVMFNSADSTHRKFQLEQASRSSSNSVLYQTGRSCADHTTNGGWVQLQLQYNANGNHQLAIFDVNGNQIGPTMTAAANGGDVFKDLTIGHAGPMNTGGHNNYWDSLIFNADGTFPITGSGGGGPGLPTVTTTAASSITNSTASTGGNVTADGGASVTARGVCYATTANPTTPCTGDGTGTGSFTSALSGLTAGTLYHIRAFASNSAGTAFGSDLTFTTTSVASCTAVDAQYASVQACVTSLSSGGIVNIPAGSVAWSSTLSLSGHPWTITGANVATGSGNPASNNLTFTDNTSITCPGGGCFSVTASTANFVSIGYLTLTGRAISVAGTHLQQSARLHHLHLISSSSGQIQVTFNTGYGLLDHVWWDDSNGATPMNINGDWVNGGYTNWADPTLLGSNDAVYIEDSKYTNTGSGNTEGFFDSYNGSKIVMRYNTLSGNEIGGWHGTDSSPNRGGVYGEFYGNTLNLPSSQNILNTRSGTILFWNNTITGNPGSGFIPLQYYRASYWVPAETNRWGVAYPGLRWTPISTNFSSSSAYLNTLNAPNWQANHVYAAGSSINPTSGNAGQGGCGGYNFYTISGGTSGSSAPTWTQSAGANVTDGTVTWMNVMGCATASAAPGVAAGFCAANPDTVCTANATCSALSAGDTCSRYFDGPGYPYRDQPGRVHNQVLFPNLEWGNSGAALVRPVLRPDATGPSYATANVDYYNANTTAGQCSGASSSQTNGTCSGTLVNRPNTCTAGVVYFATDSGSQGTAYQCGANNTWAALYTPFTYPHPLQANDPDGPSLPTVTTTAASSVTDNTASTGGNIAADGGAPVTARGVCYSTTANPTAPCTSDGAGTGSFNSALSGLAAGTQYHIRAFATNAVGTAYGSDLTFTTTGGSCVNQGFMDFEYAGAISTANLNSNAHPWDGVSAPGSAYRECGIGDTGAGYYGDQACADWISNHGGAPLAYSTSATFPLVQATQPLCPGTTYQAGQGTRGIIETGTGVSGANMVGYTDSRNRSSMSAAVWFCSDMAPTAANVDVFIIRTNSNDYVNVEFNQGGTDGGGNYRVMRSESNGSGTGGSTASYKYYQKDCTDHTAAGGWVQLQLQYNKSSNHLLRIYGVNGNQLGSDMTVVSQGNNPQSPSIGHAGTNQMVPSGQHNYYDSLQWDIAGTFPIVGAGGPVGPAIPTVTTTAASSIADTTASTGGNVTADGGATVTARGTCYATTASPTSPCTSDGTGTGSFTSALSGLAAGTLYHIRAFATNSVGTAYGSDLTFTTTGGGSGSPDFYVNNTGTPACSDSNPGTSAGAPWCTIGKAINSVTPGTRTLVTGTYTIISSLVFNSANLNGTDDVHHTTFDGGGSTTGPGETGGAVLNCGGRVIKGVSIGSDNYNAPATSYFTLRGFEITGCEQGIMIFGSDHILIEHNHIHDVQQVATKVAGGVADSSGTLSRGSSYVTYSHNEIDHTGTNEPYGEALYIGTSCSNYPINDTTNHIVVTGNYVHDTVGEGIELKPGLSDGTIVDGNIFTRNNVGYSANEGGFTHPSSSGGGASIEVDAGSCTPYQPGMTQNKNHIIRNNVCYDTGSGTGQDNLSKMYNTCIHLGTGSVAYNNVVYGLRGSGGVPYAFGGIYIDNGDGGPADTYTRYVYHNTVDAPTNKTIVTGSGTVDIQNNIGPATAGTNLAVNSSYFADYAGHDYHLVVGSAPVKNPAAANLLSLVPTDIVGIVRTSPPDLGAYEFGGTSATGTGAALSGAAALVSSGIR